MRLITNNETFTNIQFPFFSSPPLPPPGDVHQAEVRSDEEGVRAECPVRLRDRPHHLQPLQQAVPVRQHRHGQGPAQVHRVQRAAREPDQCRHHRGKAREGGVVVGETMGDTVSLYFPKG